MFEGHLWEVLYVYLCKYTYQHILVGISVAGFESERVEIYIREIVYAGVIWSYLSQDRH